MHFCVERIDQGLNPFCIDVCPERARYFGDLNDEDSDVSKLIRENPVKHFIRNWERNRAFTSFRQTRKKQRVQIGLHKNELCTG
jgi:Fe-S-cluster-containing dehydrogenase component